MGCLVFSCRLDVGVLGCGGRRSTFSYQYEYNSWYLVSKMDRGISAMVDVVVVMKSKGMWVSDSVIGMGKLAC